MSEKVPGSSPNNETNPNEVKRVLDRALQYGDLADVETLFEAGMDIDQTDPQGRTALMLMASKGNKEGVEKMLARGASINVILMFQGRVPMTALDAATQMNQPEIADLLRSHGAKTGKELTAEG